MGCSRLACGRHLSPPSFGGLTAARSASSERRGVWGCGSRALSPAGDVDDDGAKAIDPEKRRVGANSSIRFSPYPSLLSVSLAGWLAGWLARSFAAAFRFCLSRRLPSGLNNTNGAFIAGAADVSLVASPTRGLCRSQAFTFRRWGRGRNPGYCFRSSWPSGSRVAGFAFRERLGAPPLKFVVLLVRNSGPGVLFFCPFFFFNGVRDRRT